jgi:hypothetical protein
MYTDCVHAHQDECGELSTSDKSWIWRTISTSLRQPLIGSVCVSKAFHDFLVSAEVSAMHAENG